MIRLFFLATLLLPTGQAAQAQNATLIVNVSGIQLSQGGELSTGLFLKPNFPKVGQQFQGNVQAVNGSTMKVVFEHVPPGTYAVVAFQDVDKDKDLKTNWVGFPKEPIGFSRNAKIKLGPPAFEEASITLEANTITTISFILR